jgi:hypothetical protein
MSLTTVPPCRASATIGFRFLDNNALTVGARFTAVGASPTKVPIATDSSGTNPLPLVVSEPRSARFRQPILMPRRFAAHLTDQSRWQQPIAKLVTLCAWQS